MFAVMLRVFVAVTLCAGFAVRALPSQTSAQRLRIEEVANIPAAGPSATESIAITRARIGRGDYTQARKLAEQADGFRIVISLDERALWVLRDNDTIRTANVGIASGLTLDYGGRKWTFRTPRGKHTVIGLRADPFWTPPDWSYAETASQYNLKLAWLAHGKPVELRDGRRLTVQNGAAGLLGRDGSFFALPRGEHIVFDSTLFVPPFGSINRRVNGQLGPYALDLGAGYLLHGGPASDGSLPPTHGCIRLGDADLEWLYNNVARGTAVYIY